MTKKEKFIERAIKKHGNKYDYSKVEYLNSQTKICIICPEHGEFWQVPAGHVRGYGCPLCSNQNKNNDKRASVNDFVRKAIKKHGKKYDYSKTEYINARTKVCIICPKHGEFWQLPFSHLNGRGCPICSGKNMSNNLFIEKAKETHGEKYDYSKVEFKDSKTKVCIICPEHGEFWQSPAKHLYGQGCPVCGLKERGEQSRISYLTFLKRALLIHGDKYEYPNIEKLQTLHSKICVICKKHGPFMQIAYDHLNGHGCPVCGRLESKSEKEIYEYICSIVGESNVIRHDRILLDKQEIDIYIPHLKIGFEYNGLRWHNEEFGKTRNYHLRKTEECNKKGVKLYQIFEDEYLFHRDVVLNKIKHLLKCSETAPKVYGRKCSIVEVNKITAKFFLDKFHIQGYGKSTLFLGVTYNDALVGVMGFKKINNNNEWELTRFATDYNYIYCGVGSKILKYFINKYNPNKIKSFADRRWTQTIENIYIKMGFELESVLKPDYRYVNLSNPTVRIHKFNFRKSILNKKHGLPLSLTESEMVKKIGYSKIWDCGLYRYVWTKKGGS